MACTVLVWGHTVKIGSLLTESSKKYLDDIHAKIRQSNGLSLKLPEHVTEMSGDLLAYHQTVVTD